MAQVVKHHNHKGKPGAKLHSVYEGNKPSRVGDRTIETQGMAPIPANKRYGSTWRMFTLWFTPNLELSGVFIGTLAVTFGLGFKLGLISIIVGSIIGALPVAIMCAWGPQTGTGQLPLARMPFGKSVVLPGLVQWLSAIGWLALGAFFGGQAAHLLFHVPFWVGAIIVLVCEAVISIFGYEYVQQAQKWGSVVMSILFAVLFYRVFQHKVVLPHNTVHGTALAGAFVLMTTVALSSTLSWASYASDYSRYLKATTSKASVFLFSFSGLVSSYLIVLILGLAAASVLSDQTAGGVQTLVGGGFMGTIALSAILMAEIISSSLNDYSASLAIQTVGVRIKRPYLSAIVMVIALAAVVWMNDGNLSGKFTNILLFASYWLAPFCAIVMIDWYHHKKLYTPKYLQSAMTLRNLRTGWRALVAFVVAFAIMIPFMDTSLVVGYFSHKMQGADLAFYVGFMVAAVVYLGLLRYRPFKRA